MAEKVVRNKFPNLNSESSSLSLYLLLLFLLIQVNLDMTDSMGPGKLVRHMQNLSYTYDEYLICIGLGPSVSSVKCENPSYSGPSYPSSPVVITYSSSIVLQEGCCTVVGISYNGKDKNGNDLWNGCANIKYKEYEMVTCTTELVGSFHISTNNWIAK